MKLDKKIVDKPWGQEVWLVHNDKYALKILKINKGHRFSLQYHEVKDESWYITKGRLLMTYDKEKCEIHEGEVIHIPPKTIHRLEALEDSEFIEVSTPELEDVVRIDDDYDRA